MGILRSLGEEKRVKGDSRDLCLFWDGGDEEFGVALFTYPVLIYQAQDNQVAYQSLKFLEELDGKIPIVHVEDVCEAHIFCAENWSINGRFLVASSYASSVDIANYYLQAYPEFHLNHKYLEGPKRDIIWMHKKDRQPLVLELCVRLEGAYVYECEKREKENGDEIMLQKDN
eukprot:XP_025980089.1 uncharacterized protein LOC112998353 [Glycine max]